MHKLIKGGKRDHSDSDHRPFISVITVSFNAVAHIKNCIQSVLNLSSQDVEHLIIDGGSTDGTLEILQDHNQQIAYWQSEPDRGIYHAMNKSLKLAQGQWLLFLGADDQLLPGFAEMIPYLKNPNCIYYGDYISNNKRYGGKFSTYRLAKSNICHHNIFYPQRVFNKYQYQEKYSISADHFLNIQCWADQEFQWKYYPFIIADFSSEGVSSKNTDPVFDTDRYSIIKKHLGLTPYLRYLFRQLKGRLKKPPVSC